MRSELDLTLTMWILSMLVEQFIRAVRAFRNKPAMLSQALRDAEIYHKQGQLSESDMIMIRRLANGMG